MDKLKKVAVGCQGGGMHAAFEVGILTEMLKNINERKRKDIDDQKRFELVGLSGTSAGALCALMTWYGLAPKRGGSGSEQEAIDKLNHFWDGFVAKGGAETVLNFLAYRTFWAEELEVPVLGVNAPVFSSLSPYGAIFKAVAACLPKLGVREQYFDLKKLLDEVCPALNEDTIDWKNVKARLLVGATEVVNGLETVFDSDVNKKFASDVNKKPKQKEANDWRQRLPLTLSGVAASGTLPTFREAEHIKGGGDYWDGLYSQNPPVREFLAGTHEVPDELWIVRINPQQWPELPKSNADVQDRQNELMGNLSLHKELDFILKVNSWSKRYKDFAKDHKQVIVRTIKMEEKTANELRYSSKFNRSRDFMEKLREQGEKVARNWLDLWRKDKAGEYPDDAAYRRI
jgi:NTE family protein